MSLEILADQVTGPNANKLQKLFDEAPNNSVKVDYGVVLVGNTDPPYYWNKNYDGTDRAFQSTAAIIPGTLIDGDSAMLQKRMVQARSKPCQKITYTVDGHPVEAFLGDLPTLGIPGTGTAMFGSPEAFGNGVKPLEGKAIEEQQWIPFSAFSENQKELKATMKRNLISVADWSWDPDTNTLHEPVVVKPKSLLD